MPIVVRIDVELAKRGMSVGEFSERIGLTPANVAVLKNGRAKAVRFTTLEAICRVLDCQPGDLLEWVDDAGDGPSGTVGAEPGMPGAPVTEVGAARGAAARSSPSTACPTTPEPVQVAGG